MSEAARALPADADGYPNDDLEAEITSVLDAYDGDARRAVRDLLLDLLAIEHQVEAIVGGISAGYVRLQRHAPVPARTASAAG
jgi:hypothetical protein